MGLHGVIVMEINEKTLKDVLSRLEKLEKAVFAPGTKGRKKPTANNNHQGARGGIQLLIESDYFGKKRTAVEVWQALEEKGYHYKRQVVQVALLRSSKVGGPLVAMKEKGMKVYANRK